MRNFHQLCLNNREWWFMMLFKLSVRWRQHHMVLSLSVPDTGSYLWLLHIALFFCVVCSHFLSGLLPALQLSPPPRDEATSFSVASYFGLLLVLSFLFLLLVDLDVQIHINMRLFLSFFVCFLGRWFFCGYTNNHNEAQLLPSIQLNATHWFRKANKHISHLLNPVTKS